LTSLKNKNKICAVIPFYNEENNITSVISKVKKNVDIIILVNDGSTDLSLEKVKVFEQTILVGHSRNLGKGAALRTGLLKSIEIDSDITITIDADNQHDPEYIPKFLEKLKNYDSVIGSRRANISTMPYHRRLSNYLTSKLLSWKTGYSILDSQSGYRAFNSKHLKTILPTYNGFEAESEMIVKICLNKLSIGYVNIPTIYGNDNSKMKPIATILGFIKVLIKS